MNCFYLHTDLNRESYNLISEQYFNNIVLENIELIEKYMVNCKNVELTSHYSLSAATARGGGKQGLKTLLSKAAPPLLPPLPRNIYELKTITNIEKLKTLRH